MWKDFFYFNKSQRIGIIVLLMLILLALGTIFLMPRWIGPSEDDTAERDTFLEQARDFVAGLREKEKEAPRREYRPFEQRNYNKEESYRLFDFDPNSADSASFVEMGLKPYIARNIIRYREKGGKFRNPEAFSKIYGISEEKFEELKPYIRISEDYSEQTEPQDSLKIQSDEKPETSPFPKKETLDYAIDINSADTTELMQVKGIGRYYARNIVTYRRLLGGFYSVEQVREVRGMTDDNFDRIKHSLTADGSQIQKIDINKASIERLKSHPYIGSFQKAKVIYDYRRKVGRLKGIEELYVLDEFSEEEWLRLTPYFEFN